MIAKAILSIVNTLESNIMEIRTNISRRIIGDYQLTEKERLEFDWIDWQAIDAGNDSASFIRYKKQLYCLDEFMRCLDSFPYKGWDGYYSDSAFSGILIKFVGSDYVIVGQYFC